MLILDNSKKKLIKMLICYTMLCYFLKVSTHFQLLLPVIEIKAQIR